MKYLGISEEILKETNSYDTAFEISNQPNIWDVAIKNYQENKSKIDEFLSKIKDYEVVFTGAGTSEYVGNILEPLLNKMQNRSFHSIPTTNIVNNPLNYLKKDRKTLLVSFARSGDSPESVASVNLANKLVDNVYHLFITCNPNGALNKMSKTDEFKNNTLVLLMPEGSNDKGFAMTSSFSSMLMTAMLAFGHSTVENMKEAVKVAKSELTNRLSKIQEIANRDHERIVILGDGPFKGLAEELTLKVMELTAGLVVAKSDSTLGFRHGPKAVINNKTIVFSMMPVDKYAKKYVRDILDEMTQENKADSIVSYALKESDINDIVKDVVCANVEHETLETAIFTYLIYGQMYAFLKSQHFNLTTDNPFPGGDVNRVVKKFKIYEY